MQCRMRAGCDYRRALSGASVDAYGRVAYMCMLYTPDGCVHMGASAVWSSPTVMGPSCIRIGPTCAASWISCVEYIGPSGGYCNRCRVCKMMSDV